MNIGISNIMEDPMAIFTLAVILLPPVKHWFDCFGYGIKELAFKSETCQATFVQDIIDYFTDRYFLAALGIYLAVLFFVQPSKKVKSFGWYGLVKGHWYLLNACFIHFLMDGCVGVLSQFKDQGSWGHSWDLMYHQYRLLDVRFQRLDWNGKPNTRYPINWVVPAIMGTMEMLIHAPLCIATYYGYKHRSAWRAPVEILASMIQLVGAIIFMYGENIRGVHNLFPNSMDSEGSEHDGINGNSDMMHGYKGASDTGKLANMGVYYYFGFWFANWIWIVVPAYFIYECTREIAYAVDARANTLQVLHEAINNPEEFKYALQDLLGVDGGDSVVDSDGEVEEQDEHEGEASEAEAEAGAEKAFDAAEEAAEQEDESDSEEEVEEEVEPEAEEEEEEDEEVEEEDKPRRGRRKTTPKRRAPSRGRQTKAKPGSRKWGTDL